MAQHDDSLPKKGLLAKVFDDPYLKQMWENHANQKLSNDLETMKAMAGKIWPHPCIKDESDILCQSSHHVDDHIPDDILYHLLEKQSKPPKLETIMSEQKEKTTVNVEAKGDSLEITHRYGEAAEVQNPNPVAIRGTIEAPSEYFTKRTAQGQIDLNAAHIEVDKKEGMVRLNTDPSSPIAPVITGRLQLNPLLSRMNINKFGEHKVTEDGLVLLIKQSRSIFTDQKEALNLINKVKNLDMRVEKEIKKSDDERGNKRKLYDQVCENDLPEGFSLNTFIFTGSEDVETEYTFFVELKFAYSDQLYFWLESQELQDIVDEAMDDIITKEVNKFGDDIPIIYV